MCFEVKMLREAVRHGALEMDGRTTLRLRIFERAIIQQVLPCSSRAVECTARQR